QVAQQIQFAKNMLGFLQQIRSHFGELPLLLHRNDRLGLVQAIGDEFVQILPALELKRNQTQFGFGLFIFHVMGATVAASRVSSNFCKLSSSRWANGRSTDRCWLMIPSSK